MDNEQFTYEDLNNLANRIEDELVELRRAFHLMATDYCKHADCEKCEINEVCCADREQKKGAENLEYYYLEEARHVED